MFTRKTPAIRDSHGRTVPGSIASLEKLTIGGVEQWILLRGHDVRKPLLLMLHGGPGTAQIGWSRPFWVELERHFVVVNWDQRGAGLSYSPTLPRETMTVERLIEDTRELVETLLSRFEQPKLFVVGHSWGSVLGTLTVQRYPHLFHGYVGVGQVGDMVEGERLSYELTLAHAYKIGHRKAIADLEALGAPPYRDLKEEGRQRRWMSRFGGDMVGGGLITLLLKSLLACSEYTLADGFRAFTRGTLFCLSSMEDELSQIDLIRDVPRLEVPVLICQGRHDWNTPATLAERFYEHLEAPSKKLVWFEASAHCPNLEENDKFVRTLIEHLRVKQSPDERAESIVGPFRP